MADVDWRAEWERLVRVAERHPGYDVWPVRCGAILAADAALRAAEARDPIPHGVTDATEFVTVNDVLFVNAAKHQVVCSRHRERAEVAEAEVKRLRAEVERLRAALVEDEEAASARIFVAEAEVERLRAALAVYADHENWGVVIPTDLAIPEPRARPRLWRYGRYGWDVAEAALRGDSNAGETGLPRP